MSGITELIGKTLRGVWRNRDNVIVFSCDDGRVFKMYHIQDCCESVTIADVAGDLSDLVGSPIISAEVVTQCAPDNSPASYTWTFYKLATAKGYVTIRWYGESNGYYGEEVDFVEMRDASEPPL